MVKQRCFVVCLQCKQTSVRMQADKSNCMNWTDPEIYRRQTGTCPACVLKQVTIIGNTHYAIIHYIIL